MSRKKKSTHRDLVLMPVDPQRLRRQRWRWLGALVLSVLLAFWAGVQSTGSEGWGTGIEQQRLKHRIASLEQQLQAARDELALHRTTNELSSQAQEQVRGEMRSLRDQLAEMEQVISYYRNALSPELADTGLRVERFEVQPREEGGDYHFRLVLSQLSAQQAQISGSFRLWVEGTRDGQRVKLPLEAWVNGDQNGASFRFRYFQELTGRFQVPEGTVPMSVVVEAESTGRAGQRVEKTFGWQY